MAKAKGMMGEGTIKKGFWLASPFVVPGAGGGWSFTTAEGRAWRAIRCRGKRLPAERVRCLSTREAGGSSRVSPPRIVVAELHDGTFEALGPSGILTWPDHWGQQAATWMGLPFRRSTK